MQDLPRIRDVPKIGQYWNDVTKYLFEVGNSYYSKQYKGERNGKRRSFGICLNYELMSLLIESKTRINKREEGDTKLKGK